MIPNAWMCMVDLLSQDVLQAGLLLNFKRRCSERSVMTGGHRSSLIDCTRSEQAIARFAVHLQNCLQRGICEAMLCLTGLVKSVRVDSDAEAV